MDEKNVSRAAHSDSSEQDSLFEAVARQFVANSSTTTATVMFDNGIGYNRACHIVEQLEAAGIVGPHRGRKPREVLVDLATLEAMLKKT